MIKQNLGAGLAAGNEARKKNANSVLTAVLIGLIATAVCFGWWSLKTHYLYQGNWTSVFYIGKDGRLPPELASENTYLFPGAGYDGRYYHLIAHDPLFRRGFSQYVLTARTRYRRILLPGLAALFSVGHDNWVDGAYLFVLLLFVYLGTFWFASWSASHGFSPAWGFLFLAVPSTLVSVLLVIMDGALGALTVGFFWYAERKNYVRLFLVLACAALTRETGIFLITGYCFFLIVQRQFVRALVFAASAVPAGLWFWFVQQHTRPDSTEWFSAIPFYGVYLGVVGHWTYTHPILLLLDFVAIGGMLLGFAFAAYYIARRGTWNAGTFVAAGFLIFGIFLSHWAVWPEVNAFGRYYSPILIFIAIVGMARGNWWTLAPMALVDLRIGSIFLHQAETLVLAIFAKRL